MDLTDATMSAFFLGLSTIFNKALESAPSRYRDVSMITESSTSEELYAWLSDLPQLREWIGDRIIKELSTHGYAIANKTWESTITIRRSTVEDDRMGVYTPAVQQLAQNAAAHPDQLLFSLLAQGFTTRCFDGQNFFDPEHPTVYGSGGYIASASNTQGGTGAPWFLLDCSKAIKPMIFQNRIPARLNYLIDPNTGPVFYRDEFAYGIRARYNVGFGLWQLAYASQQPLTAQNYAAARAAMMSQVSDSGRPLGIVPTHIVTVPALEGIANALIRNDLVSVRNPDGTFSTVSNEWKQTADTLVTQYLLGGATAAQLPTWSTIPSYSTSAPSGSPTPPASS